MAPVSARLSFFSNEVVALLPVAMSISDPNMTLFIQVNEETVDWDGIYSVIEDYAYKIDNLVFLGGQVANDYLLEPSLREPFVAFLGVNDLCVSTAFNIVDWGIFQSLIFVRCSFNYRLYDQFSFDMARHVHSLTWRDMTDVEWPALGLLLSSVQMNFLHWTVHPISNIDFLDSALIRQVYLHETSTPLPSMALIDAVLQFLERATLDTVFVARELSGVLLSEARFYLRGRADVFRMNE